MHYLIFNLAKALWDSMMLIFKLSSFSDSPKGILVICEDTAHQTRSSWCSTHILTWFSHSPRTSINLEQWVSTGAPNRHFWLSWQERCYWHLAGRDQGCCQILSNTRYSLPEQRLKWPKISTVPRLRNLDIVRVPTPGSINYHLWDVCKFCNLPTCHLPPR